MLRSWYLTCRSPWILASPFIVRGKPGYYQPLHLTSTTLLVVVMRSKLFIAFERGKHDCLVWFSSWRTETKTISSDWPKQKKDKQINKRMVTTNDDFKLLVAVLTLMGSSWGYLCNVLINLIRMRVRRAKGMTVIGIRVGRHRETRGQGRFSMF